MKKRYKMIALALAGICALSITACSGANTNTTTTTETPATEEPVGMPNPMVEVTDASEFENNLGITVNPQDMDEDAKLYIIDGNIAQVSYTVLGVEDGVDVTFRASKEVTDLSGVYDDNMEEDTMDYEGLSITNKYSADTHSTIYEFNNDGIYYSIVIQGEISQMHIAEILDSTLLACGLE